jgi:predicted RND superfamily exporter protein
MADPSYPGGAVMTGNPIKERLGSFIYTSRFPVIAAVIIVCAVFMVFLKDVKLDEDPMAGMYPAGHPLLAGLKAIEKMAPRANTLVCLLEAKNGDIYNKETIKKIDAITKSLMDCEVISPQSVTSLTKGMDNYEYTANGLDIVPVMGNVWPETPEQFAALKRRVATNPMGSGKYVSYDGKAVMITANLVSPEQAAQTAWQQMDEKQKAGLTFDKFKADVEAEFDPKLMKKLDELRNKIADGSHEILFMGEEVIKADMTRMGMTRMPVAGGIMFVLMIALIAVYFRSWQAVLISVLAMILPAGAGLGLFSLLGMSLNPMAVLFPLTAAMISVAASVVIMDGFYRSLAMDRDRVKAVAASLERLPVVLVFPILICLVKVLAKTEILRQAGTLGAISLFIILLFSTLLVPALASVLPGPSKGPRSWSVIAESLIPSGGMKGFSIAVLAVIIALGGFAAYNLAPGNNIPGASYLWKGNQWNRCFDLFTKKFMGPNQLLVYVKARKEGGLTEPAALQDISAFSNYLKYRCGAKDSIAFDYMVQMARYTMSDGSPKWQTLPENEREGKGLGGMVTENSDVKEFIDATYTQATISPFFPNRDEKSVNEYVGLMQDYIDKNPSHHVEFRLGGGLLGMVKIIDDGIPLKFIRYIFTALAALMIILIVLVRSIKAPALRPVFAFASQLVVFIAICSLGLYLSKPVLIVIGTGIAAAAILIWFASDEKEKGAVLFATVLIFLMSLPWFFTGMRFQAFMVMVFAIAAVSGGVLALVFLPLLKKNVCDKNEEVNI